MSRCLGFILVLMMVNIARADVVTLKNGDRITGQILDRGEQYLKMNTDLLGEISIKKELIDKVESNEQVAERKEEEQILKQEPVEIEEPKAVQPAVEKSAVAKYWEHKLSAGYVTTNGNTKTSHANMALDSHYKKERDEWKIKSTLEYGSDNGKMNVQKSYSKAQSDYRFGKELKWFNSRTIEVTHDKFSSIDYRILPAIGIGYWFWEGDHSKFETDLALGYEYTNYNVQTKSTGNFVLIPHLYYDKVLVGKLKFAQDLTMYPSLGSFADYRFRSETSLINPLSDVLSWKLSLIDEYNSNPQGGAKKNDTTFMSSIEYAF